MQSQLIWLENREKHHKLAALIRETWEHLGQDGVLESISAQKHFS